MANPHGLVGMLGAEAGGAEVLRELGPDPLCFATWQVLRLVTLWTEQPPQDRRGVLDREGVRGILERAIRCGAGDVVGDALVSIAAEIEAEKPDPQRIARASLVMADWAISRGSSETALAFARAAALARGDSRSTWIAGRLHRENGRVAQSEPWFRESYRLATREGDVEMKASALMAWGQTLLTAGRYAEVRGYLERALALANRFRLGDRKAQAHHHLFTLATATGDHAAAARHGRAVAAAYGADHPRHPYYAHDLAAYWMDAGEHRRALTVFLHLLERHFEDDEAVRLLATGSAARASGGAGDHRQFDQLIPLLVERGARLPRSPFRAQALLLAARGAASLRRWCDAEDFLVPAIDSARETGQEDTLTAAEELLARIA